MPMLGGAVSQKPETDKPSPAPSDGPRKLTAEELNRLAAEGLEVRRKLADRIAPMQVVTSDDLKTRVR